MKAGITCNLYGSWKKSRWWGKGNSKPGISPKSCWVNLEAIKSIQPFTRYSPKGYNRSSDKCLLQTAGLRRWGDAQASAHCSVSCWLENETWMQGLLCHCHAVLVRWKSWVFKSWRGCALHREWMHEDPFLLKIRKTSALASHHLQPFLQILAQSTSVHWIKNNNKNTAVKVQTVDTIIPRSLYPFIFSVMRFCPLL